MPYRSGELKRAPKAGLGPRNCKVCGAEFQPYRSNHWVCSRACQSRTPESKAKAKARRETPEARERANAQRRLATTRDQDALRALNLKSALRKYGVTPEWFAERLDAQDGACLLCGHVPPPDAVKAASRLHVDHDHATGAVRALLCGRCNQGIGFFAEDPELMRRAAAYIESYRV